MFLDSYRTVFTFRSWLDLQGVVLVFGVSILKILNKQNRSTEGCSKLKSPTTRQVKEILVSTLEHLQVPKWDRIRCPVK